MRIWTAPYHLTPRRSLSSRAPLAPDLYQTQTGAQSSPESISQGVLRARPRNGSLLKVEFGSGEIGFADLHPWVELGDEPLKVQLAWLSEQRLTTLTERSIALAQVDAHARAQRVSALDGLTIPDSHYLLTEMDDTARGDVVRAQAQGFSTIKMKVGRDLEQEAEWLLDHEALLDGLQLRLDANAVPHLRAMEEFLDRLPQTLLEQIEFIEDPCAYHPAAWAQISQRVPVAFDQARGFEVEAQTANGLAASAVSYLILKPAVQDPEHVFRMACDASFKISVTSYLDHPLGQVGAAWIAGRLDRQLAAKGLTEQMVTCGLLSQVAYEPNEFTRAWFQERPEVPGPEFLSPLGHGFGFDELLENQPWKELK